MPVSPDTPSPGTPGSNARDAGGAVEDARFRAVVDQALAGVAEVDLAGTFTLVNAQMCAITGYCEADLLGRTLDDITHPDDLARCLVLFESAIASGSSFVNEKRWVRADGTVVWVTDSILAVPDVDGVPQSVVMVVIDITARKQAEAERERLLHAEHAARMEAEAALKTREQFLSVASHELRTPLTSLVGYAAMLPQAMRDGVDMTQQMTERIMYQAQRLNGLIDQFLDSTRLQRGQFAVDAQPLDVASLVAHVVDDIRVTASPKHVVDLHRPDEPVMVAGDTERLEQVVQNLLGNAVKYSPAGGTIRVSVERSATEAVVVVRDEGIGMSDEAQARVFEPFYRAPSVRQQVRGFGLGLYIVREIIVRHGGRIEVESTEGIGTTVRVIVPLLEPNVEG